MSSEDAQRSGASASRRCELPYQDNASSTQLPAPFSANFINLLVKAVAYDYKLKKFCSRKTPHEPVSFEVDDSHRFRNSIAFLKSGQTTLRSLSGSRSSSMKEFIKKQQGEMETESKYIKSKLGPQHDDILYPIDIVEWENDIEAWDESEQERQEYTSSVASKPVSPAARQPESKEEDSWEQERAFAGKAAPTSKPELHSPTPLKDSGEGGELSNNSVLVKEYVNNLLASNWEREVFNTDESRPRDYLTLYVDDPNLIFEKSEEKKKAKNKRKGIVDKPNRNRYNISNDKYYLPEGRKASLGTFGVQHSLTALKLDDRFYRVNLPRDELRNLHRPLLSFENTEYHFITDLIINDKGYKKKNSKRGEGLTDLQIDFAEQHFRRGSELSLCDQTPFYIFEYSEEIPFFVVKPGMVSLLNRYYRISDSGDDASPEGCITLDNEEENPFFGFGEVRPGSLMQTITNNLFIAPVFPHRASDYLCIQQGDGIVARPFDSVFLVGQEFAKEEVFAPHSRKLNQFCKDRLKVAAHRAFTKGKHLLMSDLDDMFPYFSEGSKRKWLKEYADCIKKGRDNVWVLLLNEEDVRKLVLPEHICQYESMLACEIKMQMMGLRCSENEEDDGDTGRFCPSWSLSRNFVNAANGRGLLELNNRNDDGDIFFNFRRVKLKKGNEAENRRILSEHQASYKERIGRIWNRQLEFLSSAQAPECIPTDVSSKLPIESETVDESKVLIIKRTFIEHNTCVERIVKVYDSKVIRAYLRAREKTTVEKKGSLTCSNCGQSGHMKTNKTCPNYINVAKNSRKKFTSDKKRARNFLQ